jgi:uncharacterized protein (DUF1501 family)
MSASRRDFLIGCSTAIAALAGSRLTSLSFAAPGAAAVPGDDNILVVIFLRGGMDALHLLGPVNDPNYIAARPENLRLTNSALQLKTSSPDLDFRLHPNAKPLKELYDGKSLAFVHAAGLTDGTRSHFEAMDIMERGFSGAGGGGGAGGGMMGMSGMTPAPTGSRSNLGSGWLTRFALAANLSGLLPAASANGATPNSLLGYAPAMPLRDLPEFRFPGSKEQLAAVRRLYAGTDPLHASAIAALTAFDTIQSKLQRNPDGSPVAYKPATDYGDSDIANSLKTVAHLIKLDLGLRLATVDFGGWDTHQSQSYHFPILVQQLSTALSGFYNDLSKQHAKLTVVVQSEFGRRLKANQSNGTDHGHGGIMMLLGGAVAGGQLLGNWPGLATEQLDARADLAVTTDFRHVLSQTLQHRFRLDNPATVFPNLPANPNPLPLFT